MSDDGDCEGFFQRVGASQDVFQIGMFGRVEQGKGQHFLVDAIASLKQQGIEVHAMIIGHVMDEDYLQQLNEKINEGGLTDQITMVDFVRNPEFYR